MASLSSPSSLEWARIDLEVDELEVAFEIDAQRVEFTARDLAAPHTVSPRHLDTPLSALGLGFLDIFS